MYCVIKNDKLNITDDYKKGNKKKHKYKIAEIHHLPNGKLVDISANNMLWWNDIYVYDANISCVASFQSMKATTESIWRVIELNIGGYRKLPATPF